jgi:hypothetical protein
MLFLNAQDVMFNSLYFREVLKVDGMEVAIEILPQNASSVIA